jgi:hypothetical protein
MNYHCCNPERKAAVLQKSSTLNGIDYLEVLDHDAVSLNSPRQQTLLVYCLRAVPALSSNNVLIEGGESITDVGIDWVGPASGPLTQANPLEQSYFSALTDAQKILVVRTTKAGDFSPYTLRLVNDASTAHEDPFHVTEVLDGFDTQLAEVEFSFKVECGPDFECAPQLPDCPPTTPVPPPINYLAKDYGSFRTIMLDRLSQLVPTWGGTSEADLGVALTELIAYVGDYLSYQQDAVATESYLMTARSRVSLRRHALLVDYPVHDGCNARAWIHIDTVGNPGDHVPLDRTHTRFYTSAPGMPSSLAVGSGNEEAALLSGVQVFEPMCDAVLYPEHNQMSFYTWGDTDCCLPRGATEATLKGSYPNLQVGDVLIFQEVFGPQTEKSADADIRHRCAVRLTQVATQNARGQPLVDPLFTDGSGKPIQVTELQWSADDALPFPLCISSSYPDSNGGTTPPPDVSVAFGNIVLADHGLTLTNQSVGKVPPPRLYLPPNPAADRCNPSPPTPVPVRFRPKLQNSPLTQAVPLPANALAMGVNPITTAVVMLGDLGFVTLTNSLKSSTLMLQVSDPAGWPSLFGVVVAPNASTATNIDLSVVYNPPGGAAGVATQVIVEKFTNLSLKATDPNYAPAQINSTSRLIQVPASYAPPATLPSGFPATPTMLHDVGAVNLQDLGNPPVTYLTLEATDPSTWPHRFGVSLQPSPGYAADFELLVVYKPQSGGVGVTLPVTVEAFTELTLMAAGSQIGTTSSFIKVQGFSQTTDPRPSASELMNFDPSQAVPAITLTGTLNTQTEEWTPLRNLLESQESDRVFVVEVESDGTATLRFGDDTNGKAPDSDTSFVGTMRIGNGTAGNVGADSLVHLAASDARLQSCRNPLPAVGGTDPETNDQIRRRAPQAFLTQERAVTMADYEAKTETNAQVERAVASLRWTGSWYTVFIAVEPKGGGKLTTSLQRTLKSTVNRYRLAGQDLQLESPQYVSLEIELEVCVDPAYFRSDVQGALKQVLGNQILPDGQKGLFYPDNFTFGQTVYLSPVYAAARSVAGVVSVTATKFQPQGVNTTQYLDAGEIKLGSLQVARLENDPSYPDHGQLTLIMEGGK